MGDKTDRRRGDRIPINEEFSSAGSTWVSDLSLGGAFVHSEELLPVGSLIELRFTVLLDDPVVIETIGTVVRHSRRPQGMGVEFSTMRPEMSLRIEDVLARQRPLDSGAPLRLPEPSREVSDDDPTNRVELARPAPIGEVSFNPTTKQAVEDAATSIFPRMAKDDPQTTVFRPPSFPGSKPSPPEVDENEHTRLLPAMKRDRPKG